MIGTLLYCLFLSFVLSQEEFTTTTTTISQNLDFSDYVDFDSDATSYSDNYRALSQDQYESSSDIAAEEPAVDSAVTMRLYGNTIMGYYYVSLFFGSPLQRQNLIVDTGSTITTVPCTECGSECGTNHLNKAFDPASSSTNEDFKRNERFNNYVCTDSQQKCPFQIGYTEGSSYQGHFTKDFVVFGNEIEDYYFNQKAVSRADDSQLTHLRPDADLPQNTTNSTTLTESQKQAATIDKIVEDRKVYMPFGCTTKETKLFYYQEADGILGLGVYTNSQKLPPNVVDVFGLSKEGAYNAFSICLADEGGLFTVGGYNKTHHDTKDTIKYVPYYADQGQYRVHLKKIKFEGGELNVAENTLNEGQGAFFDSGTTLAYAPSETVSAVRSSLNSFCAAKKGNCGGNKRKGMCWLYNPDTHTDVQDFFDSFGSFTFHFGDDGQAKYDWKAEDYLYQEVAGSRWFCLGLEVFEDRTILGGTFMKNHDIIFDKREKKIGFIRANCTTDIPVWGKTDNNSQDPATSDNLVALLLIVAVAFVIYSLIRANRIWHDKTRYFFPVTWVESTKNFGLRFGNYSPAKRYNKA